MFITIMQIILALVILSIIGFIAAYFATRGDYTLPETVDKDPTLPQITLSGHTFHSETFGEPNKPVVIVLHGGPGADYRALLGLQALADQYFVVFYDQRGAGLSTRKQAETLTTQDMIDDLDLFVSYYSPHAPVHLIGHSWGGNVSLCLCGATS